MAKMALVVAALAACAGCRSVAGTSTPDGLAQLVLTSLRQDSFPLFLNCAANKAAVERLIEDARFDSDERKAKAELLLARFSDEAQTKQRLKGGFQEVLESGRDAGVDWKQTEYVKSWYAVQSRDGVQFCEINFLFSSIRDKTERRFGVLIENCVMTRNGWLTLAGISWRCEWRPKPGLKGRIPYHP